LPTRCLIKAGEYHDSVALMQTAQKLTQLRGVDDAAVVMATEANRGILREAGLLVTEIEEASANDLVIVVQAVSEEVAQHALDLAETHLARRPSTLASGARWQARTVRGAVRSSPQSNVAVISVAGRYAAAEAWEALKSGLHVLLFSDNVSLRDEVALKHYAAARGLLLMGAGCGTAIINGVALGFANVLPRGPVGIVAAAGTGLQEVSTLLAKLGVGITQGIGTGGRDLKQAVGGVMMLEGLKALQSDPETKVLCVVSKPPSPVIAERVLRQAKQSTKPTVVCFLGSDPAPIAAAGVIPARTLQEAAYLAAAQVEGYTGAAASDVIQQETTELRTQAVECRKRLKPGQKYLRGLFSGGTLTSEALVIWEEILGGVYSNAALESRLELKDATRCEGNCAVDLGAEEFTVGRPHPMIDNELRIRRLMQEAIDPEVGVIMLDVVLGYGAHPDPASELGPAIRQAQGESRARQLIVVTSVTGTKEDPQGLERQIGTLRDAGAIVCNSNAAAARLAGFIVAQ
jgi:FdrA protein